MREVKIGETLDNYNQYTNGHRSSYRTDQELEGSLKGNSVSEKPGIPRRK